jgi:hypothetical protein
MAACLRGLFATRIFNLEKVECQQNNCLERKLPTCDHEMSEVMTAELREAREVTTLLLELLMNYCCPVIGSTDTSPTFYCLRFGTRSASSARAEERGHAPNVSTDGTLHLPSSTRNSLAIVSGDGACSIRACRKRCAGTANTDCATPMRVAIPSGEFLADPSSPISCKRAKG